MTTAGDLIRTVSMSHLPKPDGVSDEEARDVERQILEAGRQRRLETGIYNCAFHVTRNGDVWLVDQVDFDGPVDPADGVITCLGWDR